MNPTPEQSGASVPHWFASPWSHCLVRVRYAGSFEPRKSHHRTRRDHWTMFAVHQGQLALRTFAYSINALSGQIVVLPPYRHGDHGPTGGSTQVVATEVGFGIIPLFRSTSHPEMSMAEIAADCGYSTQSLFNRHFRRLTGQTPGQFRRAHPASR